jgi:hypothetical protein
MDEALRLFRTVPNSKYFEKSRIVLLFTKLDLFMDKIKRKPLSDLFPEYDGPHGDAGAALSFITHKFLSLNPNPKKKTEVEYLDTRDTGQVRHFLKGLERKITEDLRHTAAVNTTLR